MPLFREKAVIELISMRGGIYENLATSFLGSTVPRDPFSSARILALMPASVYIENIILDWSVIKKNSNGIGTNEPFRA